MLNPLESHLELPTAVYLTTATPTYQNLLQPSISKNHNTAEYTVFVPSGCTVPSDLNPCQYNNINISFIIGVIILATFYTLSRNSKRLVSEPSLP